MISDVVRAIGKIPLKGVNSIFLKNYYYKGLKSLAREIDGLKGEENILVIGPHRLDAVVGLGGSLIKHSGKKTIVYLKDENLNLKGDLSKLEDLMGIDQVFKLNELEDHEKKYKLDEIIEKTGPDIIFAPFLLDGDRDHVESCKILLDSLEINNRDFKNIWMYEVNTPNDLRLINRVSTLTRDEFKEKSRLYDELDRNLRPKSKIDLDVFKLMDRKKGYLVDYAFACEVFVRLDYETAKGVEEILADRGFSSEHLKRVNNHFNIIGASLKNRKLRTRYNNNLNYVIKNLALKESK